MTLCPHILYLTPAADTSDPRYTKYPQCSLLLLLSWFQSLKFLMLVFLNYSYKFYLTFLNYSFHLATLPLTPSEKPASDMLARADASDSLPGSTIDGYGSHCVLPPLDCKGSGDRGCCLSSSLVAPAFWPHNSDSDNTCKVEQINKETIQSPEIFSYMASLLVSQSPVLELSRGVW